MLSFSSVEDVIIFHGVNVINFEGLDVITVHDVNVMITINDNTKRVQRENDNIKMITFADREK